MPRPRKTFSESEEQVILQAWTESGTVERCRYKHAYLTRRDKPVAWDTMRRWLALLGIREDPTKG